LVRNIVFILNGVNHADHFYRQGTDRVGHYSQAVVQDNLIYVAGQHPFDPDTGENVRGTITEQTNQVFLNLQVNPNAARTGKRNVL